MDEFKYFINRTDKRLENIETKLEQLIGFRWMLVGMAMAVSAIVGLITQYVLKG